MDNEGFLKEIIPEDIWDSCSLHAENSEFIGIRSLLDHIPDFRVIVKIKNWNSSSHYMCELRDLIPIN